MTSPLDNGVILITGASSGIGKCLAEQLCTRAKTLILVARRKERLEELKAKIQVKNPKLTVFIEQCDLSKEEEVDRMLANVARNVPVVDVLINNAGKTHKQLLFEDVKWESVKEVLAIDLIAYTKLVHKLLPPLIKQGRGGVIFVGSGLGKVSLPGLTAYSAAKHYLVGLSNGLALEVANTGVIITHALPGPVASEFCSVAGVPEGEDVIGSPLKFAEISPEKCARDIIAGFDKKALEVWPGFWNSFIQFCLPITPSFLLNISAAQGAKILRGMQNKFLKLE